MNSRLEKLAAYAAAQGRQPSTWRGLVLLASTLFSFTVSEEKQVAIVALGVMLAGAVGALFPDKLKSDSTDSKGDAP